MNKKILMFAIMGMFLFSFASALTYQVDKEVNLTVTCLNDGYCLNTSVCNINVVDPNSNLVVDGENMTYTSNAFKYNLTNTVLGEYRVSGYCADGSLQDEINYNYNVTPNGKDNNGNTLVGIIFLSLLFSGLIFMVYSAKEQMNFKGVYEGLLRKYQEKNYIKFVIVSLWYNLLKNAWIIYYTLGFVVMMLVFDLTYLFDISSVYRLMESFLSIYAWGFIVVGMVFLSYLQEFIINMSEEVTNMEWGFEK